MKRMKLKMIDTYRGLPRNMYIMFTATVINRFGDFVMPYIKGNPDSHSSIWELTLVLLLALL